jgi:hypothetical protein
MCGGGLFDKRIPRLDWNIVDDEAYAGAPACPVHDAVKDHPEVRADFLDVFKEVLLVGIAIRPCSSCYAVKMLPDNSCAMAKFREAMKTRLSH